jgi:hypothetical protein
MSSAALFFISLVVFAMPFTEYMETGLVTRMPTLVVAMAFGTSALLSLVLGVVLESTRVQSRQFYELALTLLKEQHEIKRAIRS